MKLSEKIYACRKRCGLSQEALAERLGVSRQAVSKWETGDAEPELSKLRLLADAFGVTADWLLSEEGMPEPAPILPPVEEPASHAQPASTAPADWLNAVPGFIGRMLRRYGWLFGVYLMLAGLGFALLGGVASGLAGSMEHSFNQAVNQMGGFGGLMDSSVGGMTWYDSDGNVTDMPAGMTDEIAAQLFGSTVNTAPGMSFTNPVVIFGRVIMVLGILTAIGGGTLAVILKKRASGQ